MIDCEEGLTAVEARAKAARITAAGLAVVGGAGAEASTGILPFAIRRETGVSLILDPLVFLLRIETSALFCRCRHDQKERNQPREIKRDQEREVKRERERVQERERESSREIKRERERVQERDPDPLTRMVMMAAK